jgi:dephospho-CoA kinase
MRRQSLNKKRIILGLTGDFGSGKTTVAKIFKSSGFRIIDADKIAHQAIKPGSKIYNRIIEAFGRDILSFNGNINRQRLAQLVFKEERLLKKLNQIMHPQIISTIKQKLSAAKERLIILDAPLLIESGLDSLVDGLIVVKADRKIQINRLLKRTFLDKREILRRIKSQLSIRHKLRLADFIIDNSGNLKKTKEQVGVIRRQLWKN